MLVFIHQVAALSCANSRYGRHLESVTSNKNTPSVDAYLLKEQFRQLPY